MTLFMCMRQQPEPRAWTAGSTASFEKFLAFKEFRSPARLPSEQRMPSKPKLGQNFLVDVQAAQRIVAALGELAGRTVVEIGPGQGAITGLWRRGPVAWWRLSWIASLPWACAHNSTRSA